MKQKNKTYQFLILIVLILAGGLSTITFQLDYLNSIIIGLIPSTVYLIYLTGKDSKHLLIQSIARSIPATIVTDTIAHINNAWFETSRYTFRILGQHPIETLLRGALFLFICFAVYHYFFDDKPKHHNTRRTAAACMLCTVILGLFLGIHQANVQLLESEAFYTKYIILLGLFSIIGYIYLPKVRKKVISCSVVLVIIYLFIEYYSLESGLRWFEKGNHIMYIQYFTHTIPIEEILWFVFMIPSLLFFHEYFGDNAK